MKNYYYQLTKNNKVCAEFCNSRLILEAYEIVFVSLMVNAV